MLRRALATPLLVAYLLTDQRPTIDADVRRWTRIKRIPARGTWALLACASERTHEFRSLLYHRLRLGNRPGRYAARVLRTFYRGEPTLYLECADIGPGLFIQHGFATIVAAERIGADVWINQQVTIGYNVIEPPLTGVVAGPVIEDGAMIFAGAKVIGGVRIGRNAVVAAGAVVTSDVPDGMVAAGVPARWRAPTPGERLSSADAV